jgi:hypothetical protein
MEPPKLARWILNHLGCSPNNTAVIGDLDERYRQGRSPVWYLKQVMKTLAIAFAQEIRARKLLAARAVVTGWILLLIGMFLFRALVFTINSVMNWDSVWRAYRNSALVLLFAVSSSGWAGIGWALKRLYHPHEKAMALAFISTVFAALVLLMSMLFHRAPYFIAGIGLSGNLIGLIFVLIGAGMLRNQPRPGRMQGR